MAEGGNGSEIRGGNSSGLQGSFSGRCGDGKVPASLRRCLGSASSLARHAVPVSLPPFSSERLDLGAFLCSPSEGLQLFSCLMSVLLLFGPDVVQTGPTPPFWGLGRCGCCWLRAAAQLVSVSRDLAAVWEEKNTNTAIKWQDVACYRIKSGL